MKNWFADDWIKLIQWKAVFDFDSDGLAKFLQDSNDLLLKPNFIEGNDYCKFNSIGNVMYFLQEEKSKSNLRKIPHILMKKSRNALV